jgi:hypothetical protein
MPDGVDPVELRKLAEQWRVWATVIELKHKESNPVLVQNIVAVLEHCAKEVEALVKEASKV